jgi:hypothetical protein
MHNMNNVVGSHDIVLITIDTLRYDVAATTPTPVLAGHLPGGRWEARHAPGNFTYASHLAMFAGFLPTPTTPGPHPRLFAGRFSGSETTTPETWVFDSPDLVSGLASVGYHTVCVGGVGFFNKRSPIGSVLPGMFAESHWEPSFGVTSPTSTRAQVDHARSVLASVTPSKRLFLFMNVSALHQPNWFYGGSPEQDTLTTHAAALRYVDTELKALFEALRRPSFVIVCSDHGTAYGEDGYWGHRLAHETVWTVPYGEFFLEGTA